MAKKYRRLKRAKRAPQSFASMSVDDLLKLRDQVEAALGSKASKLEQQLGQLVESDRMGRGKRRGRPPGGGSALRGTKVAPKYRSKKNPKLTWSGRGAMVGWMKEEIKGTKLK